MRCGACGDAVIGSHYHEPSCPGCGLDLTDGVGSDADDDVIGLDESGGLYCVACGESEPLAGWVAALHREHGNAPPERERDPFTPDEIAARRALVTIGSEVALSL